MVRRGGVQRHGQESYESAEAARWRSCANTWREEIERRQFERGDDLISALVAARDDNETLSSDELLAFVVLLLVAGNETTTNLIGNGLLALARNPASISDCGAILR